MTFTTREQMKARASGPDLYPCAANTIEFRDGERVTRNGTRMIIRWCVTAGVTYYNAYRVDRKGRAIGACVEVTIENESEFRRG